MSGQLIVGHTYRSKRQNTRSAFAHAANDRTITAITALGIEYEIPNRKGTSRVESERFFQWAVADVTERHLEKTNQQGSK